MLVYQTDYSNDGRLVAAVEADPDPMEEGSWLIPAGAVEDPPPDVDENSYARWTGEAWEVVTPALAEPIDPGEPLPPAIPPSLTPLQARKALRQAGLKERVDAYVAGLSEEAQEEWEYATMIGRDHSILVNGAAALGLTEADVDALFVLGATL